TTAGAPRLRACVSWHAHRVDRVHEALDLGQELPVEREQLGAAVVALRVPHEIGAEQRLGVQAIEIRDALDHLRRVRRRRLAVQADQRAKQRREAARAGLEDRLELIRVLGPREIRLTELDELTAKLVLTLEPQVGGRSEERR